jgi:hypothetical protein
MRMKVRQLLPKKAVPARLKAEIHNSLVAEQRSSRGIWSFYLAWIGAGACAICAILWFAITQLSPNLMPTGRMLADKATLRSGSKKQQQQQMNLISAGIAVQSGTRPVPRKERPPLPSIYTNYAAIFNNSDKLQFRSLKKRSKAADQQIAQPPSIANTGGGEQTESQSPTAPKQLANVPNPDLAVVGSTQHAPPSLKATPALPKSDTIKGSSPSKIRNTSQMMGAPDPNLR